MHLSVFMNEFVDALEGLTHHRILTIPKVLRPWSLENSLQSDRGAMISGPRGIGKTTFLLLQARQNGRALYLSADHPKVNLHGLYELGANALARGYKALIIDEVHFARNWAQEVKALYDDHPQAQIWVSDSSSVILRMGAHDLSRRLPRLSMPILSFREFLSLKHGLDLKPFHVLRGEQPGPEWGPLLIDGLLPEFKDYLRRGARPFFLEGRYREKSLGIIEKTIFHDVPFFLPNAQGTYLSLMQSVLSFLAVAPVPTLNIDALCREWAIGKPKLYELLTVMTQLEMLHIVRKATDHTSGKGAKILLADPSWYGVLGGNLGSVREAFIVAMLINAGIRCHAAAQETDADLVTPFGNIEVGGAKKKRKAATFVARDDIMGKTPSGGTPLWMFGCLY